MTSAPSLSTDLSSEELEQIEKELLDEMLTDITFDRMNPQDAQELAKEFLSALPFHDKIALLEKLRMLAKKYPQAQSVYLDIAIPFEKQEREQKLEKMATYLKLGKIKEALAVAKGENIP